MAKDLFLPILSGGVLVLALGASIMTAESVPRPAIVVLVLLLVSLSVLTAVYVSEAARRSIAALRAFALIHSGRGGNQPPDVAEVAQARTEVRAAVRALDDPKWHELGALQDAVDELSAAIERLGIAEASERPLDEAVSAWAQSIAQAKAEIAQNAGTVDPDGGERRDEVLRSKPPELDSRLRRLIANRLHRRDDERILTLVYRAFHVLSGMALAIGITTIFLLSESLAVSYRVVIGLAVTGIVTYYLNEGIRRPSG